MTNHFPCFRATMSEAPPTKKARASSTRCKRGCFQGVVDPHGTCFRHRAQYFREYPGTSKCNAINCNPTHPCNELVAHFSRNNMEEDDVDNFWIQYAQAQRNSLNAAAGKGNTRSKIDEVGPGDINWHQAIESWLRGYGDLNPQASFNERQTLLRNIAHAERLRLGLPAEGKITPQQNQAHLWRRSPQPRPQRQEDPLVLQL